MAASRKPTQGWVGLDGDIDGDGDTYLPTILSSQRFILYYCYDRRLSGTSVMTRSHVVRGDDSEKSQMLDVRYVGKM